MADELKDQRVVTMMSPADLQSIDDWMFANRIRSRGEAIRRLCQAGLVLGQHSAQIFDEVQKSSELLTNELVSIINIVAKDESISPETLEAIYEPIYRIVEVHFDSVGYLPRLFDVLVALGMGKNYDEAKEHLSVIVGDIQNRLAKSSSDDEPHKKQSTRSRTKRKK